MISWIKKLFASKDEDYKKMFADLEAKYMKLLKEHLDALQSQKSEKQSQYIAIKQFETGEREFIRKIAAIGGSDELKYMLYDLKQQCVEKMVEGSVEVNLQMTGILKGIDLVIKNLEGYTSAWESIVKQETSHAE